MKHLFVLLNWSFGMLFLAFGLIYLFTESNLDLQLIISSIAFIGCGLLLLPPARLITYHFTKKQLSTKKRAFWVTALLLISFAESVF